MDHSNTELVIQIPTVVLVILVPERQLEIKLNCGTLVLPFEGVSQGDVNLGPVEGSITRVQLPGQA